MTIPQQIGPRFHAAHFNWILNRNGEVVLLFGIATGRVSYAPKATWLYSFRLFLGPCKVELLWTT
jgi:hypothetical protein